MGARPGEPVPGSNLQKYEAAGPLSWWIIARFLRTVRARVAEVRPSRVVDLGCGEGIGVDLVAAHRQQPRYLGLDRSPLALRVARSRHGEVDFVRGDLLRSPLPEGWADLALCLEVLEHTQAVAPAVAAIAAHTSDRAIVSVPWEPYFRIGNLLRGKYLATLGNHPEHVHHFDPQSFARALSPAFGSVTVETCFPWLIGLCRRSDRPWTQREANCSGR